MNNEWFSVILSILIGLITSSFVSLIFIYFQYKLNDYKELLKCTLSYTYLKELTEHPEYDDDTYRYIIGFLKNDVDKLGVIITGGVCRDIQPIAEKHIEYLKLIIKEVIKPTRADKFISENLGEYRLIIEEYQKYKKTIIKSSICDALFNRLGMLLIIILMVLFIIE